MQLDRVIIGAYTVSWNLEDVTEIFFLNTQLFLRKCKFIYFLYFYLFISTEAMTAIHMTIREHWQITAAAQQVVDNKA